MSATGVARSQQRQRGEPGGPRSVEMVSRRSYRSAPTASATVAKPSRASSAASSSLMRRMSGGPSIDHRRVELHQARAGADLGVGVGARADAAAADQGKLAFDPLRGAAQHFGRERRERRARKAAGLAASRRAQRRRPRQGGVADDDAVDPELAADGDDVVEVVVRGVGRDLDQQRHRLARRWRPARASAGRRAAARPCRLRRPGVLGEETLHTR